MLLPHLYVLLGLSARQQQSNEFISPPSANANISWVLGSTHSLSWKTTYPYISSSHLTAILTASIIGGGAIIIGLIACYIIRRRVRNSRRPAKIDTQIAANESDDTGQANGESHQMNSIEGKNSHQGLWKTAGDVGVAHTARTATSPPGLERNGLASDMSPGEENGANMFTQDVSSKICATLKVEDFTVGWICALPIERAAAIATFDEIHAELEQHPSDHNIYALGRIGRHNVVVACLRAGVVGSTSAAIVATQMLFTFPSIRFGLMVGIGGGAPSPSHDIRLGDVVVSNPQDKYGGVVQYDFGKTIADGRFILTGQLNKPPNILLGAIAALISTHELEDSKLAQYLTEMVKHHPKLQLKYTYQESLNDRLFDAEYEHESNSDTCDQCDLGRLLHRPARCVPVVHYGLIASANQVMKHAPTRDKLRDELGVLCFEMEAAGLIDTFPCLVIRGICDYADSHKNKRWQEYAAAVAAAYTKELLSVIPAPQVTSIPTATATMQPGRSSS